MHLYIKVYTLMSRNNDLSGLSLQASDSKTVSITDCDADWTFTYDLVGLSSPSSSLFLLFAL
jgi:hypothetical protein